MNFYCWRNSVSHHRELPYRLRLLVQLGQDSQARLSIILQGFRLGIFLCSSLRCLTMDWTWDLLHGMHVLDHWATALPLIFLPCQKNILSPKLVWTGIYDDKSLCQSIWSISCFINCKFRMWAVNWIFDWAVKWSSVLWLVASMSTDISWLLPVGPMWSPWGASMHMLNSHKSGPLHSQLCTHTPCAVAYLLAPGTPESNIFYAPSQKHFQFCWKPKCISRASDSSCKTIWGSRRQHTASMGLRKSPSDTSTGMVPRAIEWIRDEWMNCLYLKKN